jgi:nucleotide-binding universal stress UspA family protein
MLESILVPLDGSSLAECVLPHVVALADAFGSQVVLLRVLDQHQSAESIHTVDPLAWQLSKTEADLYLDSVRMRLQEAGLQAQTELLEGPAAENIVSSAQNHNADLIIMSSHARSGLTGWGISSIVQKVVLSAPTSLMIVRARQAVGLLAEQRYKRLFVPLDGSLRAECVLPLAIQLVRAHQSQLVLAHVVGRPELARRTPATQEDLDLVNRLVDRNQEEGARYLEQLLSRLPVEGLDVQTHLLVNQNVAVTLHDLIEREQIDLVIVSAHGYSGEARWPYGSVVSNLIFYGTTPLLIMQDLPVEKIAQSQPEVRVRETPGH